MTTIFDVLTPRADVLTGQLTDATFAANLEQVVTTDLRHLRARR